MDRAIAALGKGRNVLGSWGQSFAMETKIRDWVTAHPDAGWDDLPADMQDYVQKVEAAA